MMKGDEMGVTVEFQRERLLSIENRQLTRSVTDTRTSYGREDLASSNPVCAPSIFVVWGPEGGSPAGSCMVGTHIFGQPGCR